MKKIMSLMLGLSLVMGAAIIGTASSAFAQEEKKEKKKKKKKGGEEKKPGRSDSSTH